MLKISARENIDYLPFFIKIYIITYEIFNNYVISPNWVFFFVKISYIINLSSEMY